MINNNLVTGTIRVMSPIKEASRTEIVQSSLTHSFCFQRCYLKEQNRRKIRFVQFYHRSIEELLNVFTFKIRQIILS